MDYQQETDSKERIVVTGGSGFIGTNLIARLLEQRESVTVFSFDLKPPPCPAHTSVYTKLDILDTEKLSAYLKETKPTSIIHLAARTDLDGKTLQDYSSNIEGVSSLLTSLDALPSIRRVLFTSTKFVCRNGYAPKHSTDFCPDTTYGESKVIGENLVREKTDSADYDWCIVRPTSIWGPWMDIPYLDFFKTMARKKYFHAGRWDPPRLYGYVDNAVEQLLALLNAPAEKVREEVFYLGDYEGYTSQQWADEISNQMHGKSPMRLPGLAVHGAAFVGDVLQTIGLSRFPITSFRLKNMRANTATVPMDNIKNLAPDLPANMKQGVENTLRWLEAEKGWRFSDK